MIEKCVDLLVIPGAPGGVDTGFMCGEPKGHPEEDGHMFTGKLPCGTLFAARWRKPEVKDEQAGG